MTVIIVPTMVIIQVRPLYVPVTKLLVIYKVSKYVCTYVTGPGKTGLICTSTGFHFLSVHESYCTLMHYPETPST